MASTERIFNMIVDIQVNTYRDPPSVWKDILLSGLEALLPAPDDSMDPKSAWNEAVSLLWPNAPVQAYAQDSDTEGGVFQYCIALLGHMQKQQVQQGPEGAVTTSRDFIAASVLVSEE